jgi:hypothetical protein
MRRRALLRAAGTAGVGGTVTLAGCTALGRPELFAGSASGTLHPADEEYVAGGLDPGGDARLFATAAPDSAPDLVGADAEGSVADTLRNPGLDDVFHVVAQLRSTPEEPRGFAMGAIDRFSWRNWSTLRVRLATEPWGSLDDIDPERLRRELQGADELVFSVVWSVEPDVDPLPETVDPVLTEA